MQAEPFLATILRSSAPGYAALAARHFVEAVPDAIQRYGEGAFELWKSNLTARLRELATALSDDCPDSFAEQLGWSRVAFRARGIPDTDLRSSLDCLRQVLEQELPPAQLASIEPLLDLGRLVLQRDLADPSDGLATTVGRDEGSPLTRKYVLALLDGDAQAARAVVTGGVEAGQVSVADAMLRVLLPALRIIGRLWHLNEIDVGVEHFCTSTTREVLAQLQPLMPAHEPIGKTVLLASAPRDGHDLGTLVTARFFELDGWRAIHLGADLPADELPACVERFQPDVLVLSATLDEHRSGVAASIESLRARAGSGAPRVVVGGPAFTSRGKSADALLRRCGADAIAHSPPEACTVARRLVGLPPV